MKLYILRHTRVDVPSGICYGQTDVPLADSYKTEFETIEHNLKNVAFERVYASPLSRCKQLAQKFSDHIHFDNRLMELHFGDWEMQKWDDIFNTEEGKYWFEDYIINRCPNGESYNDMLQRLQEFIDDLPPSDGNILIVTHAGAVRAFRVLLKQWSVKKAFDLPIAYGQITIIEK